MHITPLQLEKAADSGHEKCAVCLTSRGGFLDLIVPDELLGLHLEHRCDTSVFFTSVFFVSPFSIDVAVAALHTIVIVSFYYAV